MSAELQYIAPPTIKACLKSNAFVRGIVGPIGSGKSSGCVVEGLMRSIRQKPGPDGVKRIRGAIVRNTYRELTDTTRKTFEQWWDGTGGKWEEQDFTYAIRKPGVEIEVLFRALDRPADVKKLLSLELTWAYINECREVPKEIFDGLQGRVGRYPSRLQGGPTWFGMWFDSNPWHKGHWADELFKIQKPKDFELYEQPDGLGPDAENIENLPPGYYERLCSGKDSEWVDCYIRGKYPSSDKGSIYGALLSDLGQRGGLEAFDDINTAQVFTVWDLGGAGARGDATCFWCFSYDGDGNVDFIDYYESRGKTASHYFDMVRTLAAKRGYRYERHFLPHDAKAKSLQTGLSTEEMFREALGGSRVTVLPLMALRDGLGAGRWLLEQSTRIHPRCSELHDDLDADGLRCLREYRRAWDEERKVFSSEPVHDWTSHCADAYRGAAIVAKAAFDRMSQPEPAKKPAIRPANMGFNLDELWEANEKGSSRKGAMYR